MKVAAVVIAVLIVLGGGAFALTRGDSNDNKTDNSGKSSGVNDGVQATEPASDGQTNSSASSQDSIITFNGQSFSPATLTVKSGTVVTIKNASSQNMQFDSDPHPAHTDNEELNVETVKPGDSQTFKVIRTGDFGYHDHLMPSATGTIVVKD